MNVNTIQNPHYDFINVADKKVRHVVRPGFLGRPSNPNITVYFG